MNDETFEIWDEVLSGCGEQLEHLEPSLWNSYVAKVLIRLLSKERELNKYYKKRIESSFNVNTG